MFLLCWHRFVNHAFIAVVTDTWTTALRINNSVGVWSSSLLLWKKDLARSTGEQGQKQQLHAEASSCSMSGSHTGLQENSESSGSKEKKEEALQHQLGHGPSSWAARNTWGLLWMRGKNHNKTHKKWAFYQLLNMVSNPSVACDWFLKKELNVLSNHKHQTQHWKVKKHSIKIII